MRAGIRPHCIDLFCDTDLADACRLHAAPPPVQIGDFSDLLQAVRNVPDSIPLVWAGGLENQPDVLDQLSDRFRVCGPPSSVVRSMTDPTQLRSIVTSTDASTPNVLETDEDAGKRSGRWLIKPRRGSGGIGIRSWSRGDVIEAEDYLQEEVEGVPISALYVGSTTGAQMLAASIQLTGEKSLGGVGMQFCGNIGPLTLPPWLNSVLTEVGSRIGQHGLIGVFGADFVVSPNNVWLIEVNPRITASHEIYDLLAVGPGLLEQHLEQSLPDIGWAGNEVFAKPPCRSEQLLARLIVYAQHDTSVDAAAVAQLRRCSRFARPVDNSRHRAEMIGESTWIADIPSVGPIQRGQPFCSIYCLRQHSEIGQAGRTTRNAAIEQLVGSFTGLPPDGIFTPIERWDSLFAAAVAGDNANWSVPDACRL